MPWDIGKFGIFIIGEIAEIAQSRINAEFDGDKDIPRKVFLGDFREKILFLGTFWEILGKFLGKPAASFREANTNKEVLLQ